MASSHLQQVIAALAPHLGERSRAVIPTNMTFTLALPDDAPAIMAQCHAHHVPVVVGAGMSVGGNIIPPSSIPS
ncbi:hypothetical protein JCM25156A_25690 [Komagataeibacter kakiaceti JCM 25156]|uniref:hypothetical protein n=1 Tax=Komagataeibacter kakiaceti TaxID=943261 RepID=UPI00047142E4|nr:hypothetical protein [Komagataeibacter kakiaceti]